MDKRHIALPSKCAVLFYLLKIITKVMIKAIATNVTAINPKDNRHIVSNNIDSIIAPPPFLTEKNCVCKW